MKDAAPSLFARSAGLLLPLASVPGRFGVGDLGPGALRTLEWCAQAGFRWWQMLPVSPLGPGDSPYASSSAFAGEPLYLSIEDWVSEGLLPSTALRAPAEGRRGPAAYALAQRTKGPLQRAAFERWQKRRKGRRAFERFCSEQAHWLDPWTEYSAPEGGDAALFVRFLQAEFDRQWRHLREQARGLGVLLMGDAPIFVGAESADVASHPRLFRLDRMGQPTLLTGCPPDSFAADGQLWGHPHYRWSAHRKQRFAWWRQRMARQLELFDAVRIDHFIGFHKAWEVPAGAPTARGGRWGKTPGRDLLRALRRELGSLPLVAEDLGAVDAQVLALRDEFELPGMRVLQWGFSPGSYHAPERCPEHSVVYPGTHDNDTAAGWWRSLPKADRLHFLSRAGGTSKDVPWSLWRLASGTASHTAIVPLQDLLGLGRSARTNVPGKATGNWRWRASEGQLSPALARRCLALARATDRVR